MGAMIPTLSLQPAAGCRGAGRVDGDDGRLLQRGGCLLTRPSLAGRAAEPIGTAHRDQTTAIRELGYGYRNHVSVTLLRLGEMYVGAGDQVAAVEATGRRCAATR